MSDLLLSYYGDDLTGSTDVMEAWPPTAWPTVLFIREADAGARPAFRRVPGDRPGRDQPQRDPGLDGSASHPALAWLKGLEARFCHYKVCSTFDSHPRIGSIGRAIEIGPARLRQRRVSLVVGAPQLRRYTAFGTLFAAYQGEPTGSTVIP